MQEFSSVSVSSYEAGTLADRLNEQAGEGWSVVAIVPTGSTVTAYLSRESSGASSSSASTSSSSPSTTSDNGASSQPSPVENVSPAPAASSWGSEAAAESEPDTGITVSDSAGMGATPAAIEPVDEPGGWAVSPEPANSGQSTSSEPAAASPTIPSYDSGSSSSTSSYDSGSTSPSQESSGYGQSSYGQSSYGQSSYDAGSSAASTASTAASSASAAPAGWYADPSSRYELRYWDGSQWTEHVSRAGQQFTDPPVA